MCEFIEEALTLVERAGKTPIEIRLGRRQFQDYLDWSAQYTSSSPTLGHQHSYNNIPIAQVNKEIRRSILCDDEHELILD